MYIEKVPNRNSPPAILLRESWREGGKVCKRTVANLTHWDPHIVEGLRQMLKGKKLVPLEVFRIERSLPHGAVQAVLHMLRKIGLEDLLDPRKCRERDLVVGMIAERLLHPASKLAVIRNWHTTTLAQEMGVEQADEDELYEALDWLLRRQEKIERKLARRHLVEGGRALYDVSSSYYEGSHCPLAKFGYNRDGKKGKPIIVYGVLADERGCPVSVRVYPGNTGDPSTVPDQVEKIRESYGLSRVVLVGDRGMLTQTQIEKLKEHPGLGWISTLKSSAIRALVNQGAIQMSLFDETNLAEIASPDYPGERLVVCYNPLLADERGHKREDLLQSSEDLLERIEQEVLRRRRTPLSAEKIGLKVGKVLNRYKVGKHFARRIEEGRFEWNRNEESIREEAGLDGIYVIRTSQPKEELSPEDAVRDYKKLSQVERAFRCLKGEDLHIRPIFHRTDPRVRAHIFLCLLAYYVEWHLRRAWAPLLFADEELEGERATRDPLRPAEPSASARRKKSLRRTEDGLPVHSFRSLLNDLSTLSRNTCRFREHPDTPNLFLLTDPTPLQSKALQLLHAYPVRRL